MKPILSRNICKKCKSKFPYFPYLIFSFQYIYAPYVRTLIITSFVTKAIFRNSLRKGICSWAPIYEGRNEVMHAASLCYVSIGSTLANFLRFSNPLCKPEFYSTLLILFFQLIEWMSWPCASNASKVLCSRNFQSMKLRFSTVFEV